METNNFEPKILYVLPKPGTIINIARCKTQKLVIKYWPSDSEGMSASSVEILEVCKNIFRNFKFSTSVIFLFLHKPLSCEKKLK